MKGLAANYSIVIGAVFVATALVLGFLAVFSENALGIKFSNISSTHLLAFLTGGLVPLVFGSKLRLTELRKRKKEVKRE